MSNKEKGLIRRGRLRYFNVPSLDLPDVAHVFGTRDTGNSSRSARQRIRHEFPEIEELITIKQVHGRRVVEARWRGDATGLRLTRADAVVTGVRGLAVCVRTADCVPVLIFDPEKKAVAAIHSGWKGTALRAAAAAIETMQRLYNSDPAKLRAGIGPCIGTCHYQVDGPVISALKDGLGKKSKGVLTFEGDDHARLDLVKANRIVLEEAGVPARQIGEVNLCTHCRDDLFFSYRREGKGVPSLYHFIVLR